MDIHPQHSHYKETPLEQVLHANQRVAVEINEAAEELAIVHVVLDSNVPESARIGDVGAAIERTETLEKKLKMSGAQLEAANAALSEAQRKLADKA